MLNEIAPLIQTFNEAPNLGRIQEKLAWAKNILVLASFCRAEAGLAVVCACTGGGV